LQAPFAGQLRQPSANVQKQIEEMQEKERKEAPVVLTFIIKETEKQIVMDALDLFEESDKNKALLALSKSVLEKQVKNDGAN
jgi:geranylgeranyl pyrophosphate synthase